MEKSAESASHLKKGVLSKINSPFPYYLNDDKKNTILAAVVGLFVIFFLMVYKPQNNIDLVLTTGQKVMFGGITFIMMFLNIVVLPKLIPALDPVQWTIKKYILHTLWICFTIVVIDSAIDAIYVCPEKPLFIIIIHVCTQVALTGIIPIAIMTLLFRNNMLRANLKNAIGANQQINKIQALKKETKTNHAVILHSDTTETLSLNLPDLLFIEADDNYSTIVWKNGHGIEKKLLRVNLKNIETQLNNAFTIRCHRSYIVNIHAIGAISGNTNGYKLQIRDTDYSIPVSRQKGKELMEKISQLQDMMVSY